MRLTAPRASTFWIKPALALALAGLADLLFYEQPPGSTVGLFALALVAATLAAHAAVRKDRRARWSLLAAAGFALVQIDEPSLLGWLLVYTALGVAVLSPRAGVDDDGWRWCQRLLFAALFAWVAPLIDLLSGARRPGFSGAAVVRPLPQFALPLVGGVIFLALFASANPVIGQVLADLQAPPPDIPRILFWLAVLVLAWTFLRPRHLRWPLPTPGGEGEARLPGVTVASVGLSLVLFNLLFAVENGLDIAFLWSGARLPTGVSLADYAHRGAYPLIATALLAGLFVLVALRPGSQTARTPWLRALVILWVAQNLVLVASSILRTLDYVQAYSLTRFRIAALAWMSLVGVGLVLVCWRMLRGKTAGWLIDANLAATGLVLAACSLVDLGSVAAGWNVRHAREIGGQGSALDLCYLNTLGASALVPLSELETRPLAPAFRDRVAWVREKALTDLTVRQGHWRGWTWRGQRRLDRANAIRPGHGALAGFLTGERDCDGEPEARPATPAPLTRAQPG